MTVTLYSLRLASSFRSFSLRLHGQYPARNCIAETGPTHINAIPTIPSPTTTILFLRSGEIGWPNSWRFTSPFAFGIWPPFIPGAESGWADIRAWEAGTLSLALLLASSLYAGRVMRYNPNFYPGINGLDLPRFSPRLALRQRLRISCCT